MIDIEKYEALSKIRLTEAERALLSKNFNFLTENFTGFEKINTGNTEPLLSVLDIQNVLREDTAEKNFSRKEILSNAPEQCDGYFSVPKTID